MTFGVAVVFRVTGTATSSRSMRTFVIGSEDLSAEMFWMLNVMGKHGFFNICSGIGDLFRRMFPDSNIASNLLDNLWYCTVFLISAFVPSKQTVLLFNESLNHPLQAKQLDVLVRLLDSHFLGHAYADDIHVQLRASCNSVGIHGLLQLSMDEPNLNWKLFDTLSRDLEEETGSKLFNIGSCGLHIMHNVFQAVSSATTWDIEHTQNSLYWFCKDSPARCPANQDENAKIQAIKFIRDYTRSSREPGPSCCQKPSDHITKSAIQSRGRERGHRRSRNW